MPCKPATVPPCVILQDTAEPYEGKPGVKPSAHFKPYVLGSGRGAAGPAEWSIPQRPANLMTGDYSLPGLENVVCFERKTLSDLIGTLFGETENSVGEARANRERFMAELERMRPFGFKAIVVEGSMGQVMKGVYRSDVRPQSILGSVQAIFVDYGVPTIWAGDRRGAEYVVGWTLSRIWEQSHGGPAAKKALDRGCAPHLPWMANRGGESTG